MLGTIHRVVGVNFALPFAIFVFATGWLSSWAIMFLVFLAVFIATLPDSLERKIELKHRGWLTHTPIGIFIIALVISVLFASVTLGLSLLIKIVGLKIGDNAVVTTTPAYWLRFLVGTLVIVYAVFLSHLWADSLTVMGIDLHIAKIRAGYKADSVFSEVVMIIYSLTGTIFYSTVLGYVLANNGSLTIETRMFGSVLSVPYNWAVLSSFIMFTVFVDLLLRLLKGMEITFAGDKLHIETIPITFSNKLHGSGQIHDPHVFPRVVPTDIEEIKRLCREGYESAVCEIID